MSEQKFEKMDWLKGNDGWSEYVSFFDNKDGEVIENELIQHVCKMPLSRASRRGLIESIKAEIE